MRFRKFWLWPALLLCVVPIAGLVPVTASASELLVLSKDENSIAFVDPDTGKITGRLMVGEEPHNIAVTADGKLAFVANRGKKFGETISVVDVAARKELRRIPAGHGSDPHGMVFTAGKAYFTAGGYKAIGALDASYNQVDWFLGHGQSGTETMVVNRDGSRIYTANSRSGSISIFERVADPPDWKITVVPVGKAPQPMDLSPDGKELWVGNEGDGMLSIFDTATNKITQTLDMKTKGANRLKFTPDGKHVVLSDRDGGDLLVFEAATRKELKRVKLGKRPTDVLISPDGSRAFIAVASDNQVAVFDLKTLDVVNRISAGANLEGMAWVGSK